MTKKILCIALSMMLALGVMPSMPAKAASKDKVTIEKYVRELEKIAGEDLLLENEFTNTSAYITWTDAAVLTNRADETKNGTGYSEELYKQVKSKKRLTGITRLSSIQKDAVIKCFVKGILPGDSNGTYSQSRKLRANDLVTEAEMKKVMQRLKDKKKRIKLSPDGQVIRTTNLPKNYKSFNYILASFPNEFYEMKFMYQKTKYYYKPKNLIDYASPKNFSKVTGQGRDGIINMGEDFQKYGDLWCELIKKNLEYRLNFDYRTVNNNWISGLRDTYYSYKNDAELNKGTTDRIKNYIKAAKKNRVVVKADKIIVEPSTMYYEKGDGNYVRCYMKFKVTANTIYPAKSRKQQELIFSDWGSTGFNGLKNGKWYEAVCDVSIAGRWGDTGADYKMDLDILGRE